MAKQQRIQLDECAENIKTSINLNESIVAFLQGMVESKKSTQEENVQKIMAYFEKQKGGNMPSIRIRESGLLEVRFNYQGKRYSIYDRDPVKIFTKIKSKIKEINHEANQKLIENVAPTLRQWFGEWLEKYKKPFLSERTYKNMVYVINKHIYPTFGDVKVTDITTDSIQTFLNTYKRSKTKDDISLYFRAGMTKAHDLDLIIKNPFKAIVFDKKTKNVRDGFTIDEQRLILTNTFKTPYYLPTVVALCTGMRTSELFRLTLDDLDFKRCRIKVHQTKTTTRPRYVDVSEDLLHLIKVYAHDNNVFGNITQDALGRYYTDLLKSLGIEHKRFYCCRHSFATNHYFLGTSAKQVSEWLGHSTIQMTLNVYTNIVDRWDAEEIYNLYNNLYCYKFSNLPQNVPQIRQKVGYTPT